ncbi:hypothetical protein OHB15_35155 [Streptosporangium subroseum]|nr:hypothetical protein OHB15_35155 [Streptosporangium subroseum]
MCTAASAHVNLSLPNLGPQEQARPCGWDGTGVIVAGGAVVPADLAGLGVEIDLTAARRVRRR